MQFSTTIFLQTLYKFAKLNEHLSKFKNYRAKHMFGDKIIIEQQHKDAGGIIGLHILSSMEGFQGKFMITISGESGSGKSETATALSQSLTKSKISNVILRQDDYFVYPPKTNNFMRRKDKNWRGMKEVKLDLLDTHVQAFKNGDR